MKAMSETKTGITMRDKTNGLKKLLQNDIVYPPFYNDIGELMGTEFIMG